MPGPPGVPVVLTADRTLMAAHRLLFDGMVASSQTTRTPWPVIDRLLLPRASHPQGRTCVAPLGLRRVEAALLAGSLDETDVAVVDDAHLGSVIGPATRVVGISAGEPCGQGMSSTTMSQITGGRIWPSVLLERLLGTVRALLHSRSPAAKVVLGGPGSWQLAHDEAVGSRLGVDHVVRGYAEGNASELFASLLADQQLPQVIEGRAVSGDAIPRIRGASTMGIVEMSRGCGLGCSFCTLSSIPMTDLPVETIVADVATNLAAGQSSVAVLSEDAFRYGGRGVRCCPDALIQLLISLREDDRLRLIQLDHANIASIAQYSDDELAQVRRLLAGDDADLSAWVNVGVESASGPLLKANGGASKMGGVPQQRWGENCAEQLRRLCRAGFIPMASLVIGLPGEGPADVTSTLQWVRGMQTERLAVFPVLHAPIEPGANGRPAELSELHWRLIQACYELNYRWVPRMYWDNQVGAGVGTGRRLLMRMLAKAQAIWWRGMLAGHARRARSC